MSSRVWPYGCGYEIYQIGDGEYTLKYPDDSREDFSSLFDARIALTDAIEDERHQLNKILLQVYEELS